jgi:hypothetical protein
MGNDNTTFLKFVKLIKTGQIVRWKNYEAATRTFEIILPDGDVTIVPQRQVQRISANEELAYLILQSTYSN